MLLVDLTDDSLAQILKALVVGDGRTLEACVELLHAVRCTCTRLRNLAESSHMEGFWEAMCTTFYTFKQQPWKTVDMRPWTYADPWPPSVNDGPCTDCGLAPVGPQRLPWKDTFASAHSVLGGLPLEWLRQTGATLPDDDLRRSILSARMLLQRAVTLANRGPHFFLAAGAPVSPEKLILSVFGYCLVKLNRGKPYAPCDIFRRERVQLLRLLSGLVSEASWPELSKARCRHYPFTSVAKTFAATDEAKRMREILDMEWGEAEGLYDAIVELPGLMYGGYNLTHDDEILQMTCPATTQIGEEGEGELWSSTFHRVDQLMTPNYGVELLPMRPRTLGAINGRMMVGEPNVSCYLTMAICDGDLPLLERFLRHIPRPEDVATAVWMAICTNRLDYLKALVDSVHCDLQEVQSTLGDPPLVFSAAEHGDEEMFHYLAARLRLPSYDEENENGDPFLMIVAMRFSVDTLRTLLHGIPSHALHRHAYLYEHAAEDCKRNLFDALCWAGLTIPSDYIPLRADIETEPVLRRLVLENLGPDAAARYDGMKSDTAYYT